MTSGEKTVIRLPGFLVLNNQKNYADPTRYWMSSGVKKLVPLCQTTSLGEITAITNGVTLLEHLLQLHRRFRADCLPPRVEEGLLFGGGRIN